MACSDLKYVQSMIENSRCATHWLMTGTRIVTAGQCVNLLRVKGSFVDACLERMSRSTVECEADRFYI